MSGSSGFRGRRRTNQPVAVYAWDEAFFDRRVGILSAWGSLQYTFAEASFALSNVGLAPVYDGEGQLLFGEEFVVMLYGGATADALRPARDDLGRVVAAVPFNLIPGYFSRSGYVVVHSTFECGGYSWLKLLVWDTRLGPTYEAVAELGIGGFGESSIFLQVGGNPCFQGTPPRRFFDLESFRVRPVLHLEGPGVDAEAFHFAVHGPAGLDVVLERSTNLVDWVDWQSLTLGEVPTQLSDTNAPSYPQTFYRARKAP